jgi:hypothetical protein
MESKQETKIRKFIIVSELRYLEKQVCQEDITYSRMVEILNEKAEAYRIECNKAEAQEKEDKTLTIGEIEDIIENKYEESCKEFKGSNEAFLHFKEELAEWIQSKLLNRE